MPQLRTKDCAPAQRATVRLNQCRTIAATLLDVSRIRTKWNESQFEIQEGKI
jgi:hypothetical protein